MDHDAILNNRAVWISDEQREGLEAMEEIVFALRDRHHDFSMEISTILQCLRMAEREGGVPKLPSDWWIQVARRYSITLD
ncbi:hypothetical protein AB4090_02315 [Acidithiobacillus sp. IBUN Pt1247-S3]|uniref:hypothetical protein n=1 Tax=Acidithiobacillus sp. IBUN Pt1247-S3 TaxID=3166642 RepID=UPI0034E5896F